MQPPRRYLGTIQLDWPGITGASQDGKRVARVDPPSTPPQLAPSCTTACKQHQALSISAARPLASGTHGSKTKRVMYSFGIRGSWWENTFCKPTSHIMIFLLGFWFRELPTTWNSITPLRSSSLAASSRAECAERKLVCTTQKRNKITFWRFHILSCNSLKESHPLFFPSHLLTKTNLPMITFF